MIAQYGKQVSCICLLLATLFLTGCGPSEAEKAAARQEAIAEGVDSANRLLYGGQPDAALAALEALDQEYPNEPEILEALAFAYATKPDHALAAFYFDTVVQLDPSRADLALYAARSHSETGDLPAAIDAYGLYLQENPEDAGAWQALARSLASENRRKPALDAFLEATRRSGSNPGGRDSATIGRLYLDLGNAAQAQRWSTAALQLPAEDDSRQRALLTLIELDLSEKRWAEAENRIAQLDKIDPQALEQSTLAPARQELAAWRQERATLQKQLTEAKIAENRKRFEATQAARNNPEDEPTEPTVTADAPEPGGSDGSGETLSPADPSPADGANKLPLTTAMDGVPAALDPDGTATIEPTPLADADDEPEPLEPSPGEAPSGEPSLAEQAGEAYAEGDYPQAARLYQAALAAEPNSAPLYYELSRAYYQMQSWPQAELYAAEAQRRAPDNLRYAVNFLRAVQRAQPPERLMSELIRAKQRFPDSPDVTLALARGYERIYNNRRNAIFLYEDFLTLAPNHPQADGVRTRLAELR